MPKVSVVIPVYKSESTLRRCVESVIFGKEKDLEVILVEDCSPDGSWKMCQKLAEEYPQVRCLRNDQNRGVSYTRNRCLEAATGRYMLFVDSDDWVSGDYVKTLVDTQEKNPGKLVVCGYISLDPTKQSVLTYGSRGTTVLPRAEIGKLAQWVMIQQLWNKVFCPEELRQAGLRFNENICIGEDYQFVMDAIEAMDYKECAIIDQPLYYYVRYASGSLMSNWAQRENYEDALARQLRLERICGNAEPELTGFKQGYAYRILRESNLPKEQRKEIVRKILGQKEGDAFCRAQKVQVVKEKILAAKNSLPKYRRKIADVFHFPKNNSIIDKARGALTQRDVTVLSQNCIGGVFSHDMGMQFCSPTVNTLMMAADFIKFVSNLEHYLNAELVISWGKACPVGMLDDVKIIFMHCDTCQQASMEWEIRKGRINPERILVLCTDRDGFDSTSFEQWKKIQYPKLLFTARKECASHPDSLYFPKYKSKGCVPDLVPHREFYRKQVLIGKVNSLGVSK